MQNVNKLCIITGMQIKGETGSVATGFPHSEEDERQFYVIGGHEEDGIVDLETLLTQGGSDSAHSVEQLAVIHRLAGRCIHLSVRQ